MEMLQIHNSGALTQTDFKALEQIPLDLKKYVLAKNSKIIIQLETTKALKTILSIITRTLIDLGYKKNISEQEIVILNVSESVFDLLKNRYRNLTVDEFSILCKNGSLGDYGQFMGINLKTISDWIKGFINDENRKKAMAEWNRLLSLVQIRNYSDEEKEKIIIDGCLHTFFEYKENGSTGKVLLPVDSLCAIFYDKIKEKGLINISEEKKNEIFSNAEKIYKDQIEKSKRLRTINKHKFDDLISLMAQNANKPFINLCKKMALAEFFDELIKTNQNLKL